MQWFQVGYGGITATCQLYFLYMHEPLKIADVFGTVQKGSQELKVSKLNLRSSDHNCCVQVITEK